MTTALNSDADYNLNHNRKSFRARSLAASIAFSRTLRLDLDIIKGEVMRNASIILRSTRATVASFAAALIATFALGAQAQNVTRTIKETLDTTAPAMTLPVRHKTPL